MGGDEHVNAVSVGFARTPTRHALTENNANDINAPSSAAKLASFKGRLNGLRRRSMAPKDFRGNDGTLSLAVPWQEATRVVELAASVFDEGEFVAGVEAMVLFRPKLKKTDGDAYVKELVSQIKASKETLKMMLHKKDQLVDACKTLEEEMLSDALVMAQHAVADATAAANAAANASDTDLLGNTKMATTAELQRVSDEKERLHRQNETLQQNLVKIEEAELALQVGIDNLEEERGRIRVEEHSKIKQSLSKREADLEQRISLAEKAEAAAARARDALASSKRGAADVEAVSEAFAKEAALLTADADALRHELSCVKQQLAHEMQAKETLGGAYEQTAGDVATARAANDELKAIVATLEASVVESNAKTVKAEQAASAASEAFNEQLESVRHELAMDKDEALKMLEDNFEEEMARKDEENEMNWKSFAASSVEEQGQKLKLEWDTREARLQDELRELRDKASVASTEWANTLAEVKDVSIAREQRVAQELSVQIKELEKSLYEAKAAASAYENETRSSFEKAQREHDASIEMLTQRMSGDAAASLEVLRAELDAATQAAVATAIDETRAAQSAVRDAALAEAEREAGEVMRHLESTLRDELGTEKRLALEAQAVELSARASDGLSQTAHALRAELELAKTEALDRAAASAAAAMEAALDVQAEALATQARVATEEALETQAAAAQAEMVAALDAAAATAEAALAFAVARVTVAADKERDDALAAAALVAAESLLDREAEVRAMCEAAGEANVESALEHATCAFAMEKQSALDEMDANHLCALEAALAEAEREKSDALAELSVQSATELTVKLTQAAEQRDKEVALATQSALEQARVSLAEAATAAAEAKAAALAELERGVRAELATAQNEHVDALEMKQHTALLELEARVRFECGETKRAALANAETQSEHAIFNLREEMLVEAKEALAEANAAFAQTASDAAAKAKANKIAALERQAEEFKLAAEANLCDKLALLELNLKNQASAEMAAVRAAAAAEKSETLVGAANDKSVLLMSFTAEKETALAKLTDLLTAQFATAKESLISTAAAERTLAAETAAEATAAALATQASVLSADFASAQNAALAALRQTLETEREAVIDSLTETLVAKHSADTTRVLTTVAGEHGTALASLEQEMRAAAGADLAAAAEWHEVEKSCALEQQAASFSAEKTKQLALAAQDKASAISEMQTRITAAASDDLSAAVSATRVELESKHASALAAATAAAAEQTRFELARVAAESAECEQALLSRLADEKHEAVANAVAASKAALTVAADENLAFALSETKAELQALAESAAAVALDEKTQALEMLRVVMEADKAKAVAFVETEKVAALALAETDKAGALQQFESLLTERFAREKDAALDQQAEAAMEDKLECEKAIAAKMRAEFLQDKENALSQQKLELAQVFSTENASAVASVQATHVARLAEMKATFEGTARSSVVEHESKLNDKLSALRVELVTAASVDRELALSALRSELEGEAKHLRQVAVEETRTLHESQLRQMEHSLSLSATQKANESFRDQTAQNDKRVADAELRAATHKTRLDGVIAQLDSEKAECLRVKTASATSVAAAEAKAAAVAAASSLRAESAEQKARAAESTCNQMRVELETLNEARGASDDKRTAQLVEAKREMEITRQALLDEKARVEAEAHAVAETTARCASLEQQLVEADEVRRAMHNQIQELRGNVRVFARARPALGHQAQGPALSADVNRPLAVTAIDRDAISVTDRLGDAAVFTFDKVFGPESKQDEIFHEVSQLVQSALDGYKVCLFSYGQTGSGKTHTMLGAGEGDQRGIIPRAVQKVLEQAESLKSKGYSYTMEASYVEIYNEQIRDLLRPGADHDEKLTIAAAPAGGCPTVTGVEREIVDSVDCAAGLVRRAAAARAVEATQMNAQSSRSHTLFLLYITGTHAASGQQLTGCLNLVDLAGSERTSRSGAEGQRMKEACAINKSLSALGDVFKAIGENAKHVPYRNSKLTHLLSPCLGGDGKTLMLVNVAPESESAEESMHSLQFAAKVNAVELGGGNKRAKRNVVMSDPNSAASKDAANAAKERRQSVMPLPPGALARRASMAVGNKRPAGTENQQPGVKNSTLDRDRFGARR